MKGEENNRHQGNLQKYRDNKKSAHQKIGKSKRNGKLAQYVPLIKVKSRADKQFK